MYNVGPCVELRTGRIAAIYEEAQKSSFVARREPLREPDIRMYDIAIWSVSEKGRNLFGEVIMILEKLHRISALRTKPV